MPSSTDEAAPARRVSRARWVALVVVCVAIPVALLVVVATRDSGSSSDGPTLAEQVDLSHLPKPGDRAPGFSGRTLDGGRVSLAQYAGRPVVVTFFASWCNPCEKEMPLLEQAAKDHRSERLAVVGVTFRDRDEDARAFRKRLGVTFPALDDPDGVVARAYGVVNIPVTLFVAPDGTIVTRGFGLTSEGRFEPMLDRLLQQTRR